MKWVKAMQSDSAIGADLNEVLVALAKAVGRQMAEDELTRSDGRTTEPPTQPSDDRCRSVAYATSRKQRDAR